MARARLRHGAAGSRARRLRAARAAGLTCGLAASALALHSWAIASTGTTLGADLAVVAVAPGELELEPAGAALRATGLQPGSEPLRGALRMRNLTGAPLRVRIRALPSTRDLDGALELRARARGRTVAAAPVGRLRRWSAGTVAIPVGGRAVLALDARLRRPAPGLIADVTLELRATAARRP